MQNKQELYIFNPEHDMALANFSPFYKTPAEIIRMKEDLCFLPLWYSAVNTLVYVYNKDLIQVFKNQISSFTHVSDDRFTDDIQALNADVEIYPWGWNPALVHSLQDDALQHVVLPDERKLEHIRFLSSRERTVAVLDSLSSVVGICGNSFRCTEIAHIKEVMAIYNNVILKSPWSGSGRGLVRISSETWNSNAEGWVSRIIRTQGCVMAEPIYNKVLDFAMEFYSDNDGRVSFLGYSLFDTDSHGAYKYNYLMSDTKIEQKLSEFVSVDLLSHVKDFLVSKISTIISGGYTGYFGVDMMICLEKGEYLLHPCVEINLRMNMGVVSRILFDKYVDVKSEGKFFVEHYFSESEALSIHGELSSLYPLVKNESGRIVSGYLSLVPVTSTTKFHAYMIIKE